MASGAYLNPSRNFGSPGTNLFESQDIAAPIMNNILTLKAIPSYATATGDHEGRSDSSSRSREDFEKDHKND